MLEKEEEQLQLTYMKNAEKKPRLAKNFYKGELT